MDGEESFGIGEPAASVVSIPDPYLKVSQSELLEFRECRRRWWLRYVEGWAKPEEYYGALPLGTNIHAALCEFYGGGTKQSAMELLYDIYNKAQQFCWEEDVPKVQKDFKLAVIMLEGYFEWLEETGADQFLEIVEPEAEIEHDIEVKGKKVRILGKRDVIGKDIRTGINTLIDHKTCQSFNDPLLDLNEQSRMYLLLQRLNGSTVVQNCLWNLLRKVQRTARAEPPFFKREELYVSEDELRRYYERITGIIGDIIDVRQRLEEGERHYSVVYPTPSSDCTWKCAYRVVCPMIDSDPESAAKFLEDNYEKRSAYERYTGGEGKGL